MKNSLGHVSAKSVFSFCTAVKSYISRMFRKKVLGGNICSKFDLTTQSVDKRK